MGMIRNCAGCGLAVGANQWTKQLSASGYCMQCSANMQMQAQVDAIRNSNGLNDMAFYPENVEWEANEKEVFGETLREVPAIGNDGESS